MENLSTPAKIVAAKLAKKTANHQILSFGNGVKHPLQADKTGQSIRLRIKNDTPEARIILLTPRFLLGLDLLEEDPMEPVEGEGLKAKNNAAKLGLTGVPFFVGSLTPDTMLPDNLLTITAESPGQKLDVLGGALSLEPTQITGISMKSYNLTGDPENGNYGNSITRYKLSHLKELERKGTLNFGDFQGPKDVSTEILKIDFLKNNFNAIISQNDVLAIKVNESTRLDLALHIGARFSSSEFFFRETKAATEVANEDFPELAVEKNCGC